jgi:hypothetical protein
MFVGEVRPLEWSTRGRLHSKIVRLSTPVKATVNVKNTSLVWYVFFFSNNTNP